MVMTATTFNTQNLRGQTLLFRCQQGRGIDPSRRELVGERPGNWIKKAPTTTCEHCGIAIKDNPACLREHQQSKRCQRAQMGA
jgi:hypothetical protein